MSAHGLKITNFHYSHMTFPQGPGTEYPKWIHMSGYASTIADGPEDEAMLLARPARQGDVTIQLQGVQADAIAQPIVEPTAILAGPNNEREILLQIAAEKNIKVDARWKTERIRATVERETKDL